jgi:hypothetical protein
VSYIQFKFDTKKMDGGSNVRLYPLACAHLGAPQCDMQFLLEHVKRIKNDPNARWIYMGDGGECVTKYSKGEIYGQLLSPQLQLEALLDIMAPVRDKGLFGVRGNHGHRVFKETGLSFDNNLCRALGIPYLGVGTFANFVVNRSSYDGYFHHGTDSGISLKSKIQAAENFGRFIDADLIVTAHSHVAMELQPAALLSCDNAAGKEHTKLRHQYICGSAYDSRKGYAEDKAYPPLLPSFIRIELDGRIVKGWGQKKQKAETFRSDGQHELRHEYIQKYLYRRDE